MEKRKERERERTHMRVFSSMLNVVLLSDNGCQVFILFTLVLPKLQTSHHLQPHVIKNFDVSVSIISHCFMCTCTYMYKYIYIYMNTVS